MVAEGTDPTDETSVPVRVNVAGRSLAVPQAESSSRAGTVAPATEPPQVPPAPRKRMIITHDKYVELQTMVIMHVTEQEQKSGKGVDREELIDWYLEQKEDSMQDVEQFDYEKELVAKLLRKLVKVCPPIYREVSLLNVCF